MPNRLSHTVARATAALALFGLATGCSFHYSSGSSRPSSGASQGKPAQRGKSAPTNTASKPVNQSGKAVSDSKPVSKPADTETSNDAPRRNQPDDEAPTRNQPESDTQDPPKRTQPAAGTRAAPKGKRAAPPTRDAPTSAPPAKVSPTMKANTGTSDPKNPGDMTTPK